MKYIYLLLVVAVFFSCSDLLDENPKALASETFYNTEEEVETALNAIYVPLAENNCFGGLYPAQQEAYADYGFGRGSYTLVSEFQGLDDVNIGRVGSIWDLFYRSIRNSNIILERVPEGVELSEEYKNKAIAEARFLRGFIYMLLVRNWGEVPLRTELNMDIQDMAKSPETEIWKLIEEDLVFAATNLPNAPRKWGTPSAWSAKTVLVECLLNLKKYTEAKNIAEDIISSGVANFAWTIS